MTIEMCQPWTESEERARDFAEHGSEDDLSRAILFLREMSGRYQRSHRPTAERSIRFADLIEQIGVRRFGPDFGIPSEVRSMKPATRKLHEALIRCAKGMIKAWETWLNQQEKLK